MSPPKRAARHRKLGALRLVREESFDSPEGYVQNAVRCDSPRSVYEFMRPYAQREEVEVFWVLPLTTQGKVVGNRPLIVTRGILNSTLVHAREVFRLAILSNAHGIVAVHNHPGGDPTPSPEDRAMTAKLVMAGQFLDIPVYDHVIVVADRFFSLAEAGLL